ncbi:PaaI family thioesterase [Paenactinomyces guangxiensis]|uniref:Medium/long-chain acyl-CoA thioesterase YigI n=1 Tax=Paenactinomyces guangxiensis TaxID=1490290 RepID=A0A7W1WN06_9BACL|nr:PaaI family thioesterase [Paenactinomyces guangxiensis]MBH8590275.1 PaaI family thioesterase [Paenactinomyces guangxiensis]
MSSELLEVLEQGTEEEKEILALAMQAIRQKRERNSAYLSGFMGLSGRFVDKNVYEFRVPVTSFMKNRAGIVHGGITASLADSTIGSLINKRVPEGYGAVTTELKLNYLKPGRGQELTSRAVLVHMGRSLAVATCEISDERGNLICIASATFFILRKR